MNMRSPAWWVIPVAFLYFLTYPVWWLLALPRELKAAALEARATDDVEVALDDVVAVQWYSRGVHTIASGLEYDEYFVLDGRVVIRDSWDRRLEKRLAARGLLPAASISLGSASGLAWFGWLWATGLALAIYFVALVAC